MKYFESSIMYTAVKSGMLSTPTEANVYIRP